jgi:hypothetical protein
MDEGVDVEGWFVVEGRWAAERLERHAMMTALEAVGESHKRARRDKVVQQAAKAAFVHCEAAASFLDSAPVNARFLAGDCLRIAGWSGDLGGYLRWVEYFKPIALAFYADRAGPTFGAFSASYVFSGGLPECRKALRVKVDDAASMGWTVESLDESVGGFGALCAFLGYSALGCPERAQAFETTQIIRLGGKEIDLFPLKRLDVPWRAVRKAVSSSSTGQCPV